VVALALLGAACTSGRPAAEDGTPVPGGTLRVTVRDLGSIEPAKATGRGATFVLAQLFDSLTAVDPSSGEIRAAAASSWEPSSDGLTWTFRLAPGRFHDGTPVTAADFKRAFDRLSLKATGSDSAFQLEPVRGFKAAKVAGTATGLEGVIAPDAQTLKIALEKPFADLPAFLAHPALAPLPRSAAGAGVGPFAASPVGNGPFKMARPRAMDAIDLVRSEDYERGTAFLDRVEVRVSSDGEAAWRDYLAGNSDVVEVPASVLDSGRGRFGTGGFSPFWAAVYYGANLRLPKFSKPEVRRALSLAIDRTAIARTVYGGTKEPASGIIPRGVAGYRPDACSACEFAPDRARAMIGAAFGSSPPEITIDQLDASPSREVAAAIASNLQAIGIKVSLRAHSSKEYLALLQSGKQELAELGWLSEVPSPDGFLAQQLKSGSPNNQTRFADKTFDSLIDQARAKADASDRLELYRRAESRALELMPMIPIVFFQNHVAAARRVRGLLVDGAGLFDASKVWIAPR
jgi:peptide/nickel transport system substrate-binding protein/oligopeptide transport system substrate-binding protein